MSGPPLGFIPDPLILPLEHILPSRKTPESVLISRKFKQIVASLEAIGLIEPLSVSKPNKTGQYVLLDGHMRLLALRQLGHPNALCLVANDDESYTYNNRINRISSIQEHHMLRQAVKRGVTPDRLAKALNVDVSQIHKKVTLLEGICAEAVELLKDQHFSANLSFVLRRLKPTRQIECVELMLATNNITVAYGEALLAATPQHMLVGETKPRKMRGLNADQMAKMEREMGSVQGQLKLVEKSYGEDVLLLVLAIKFLAKMIDNKAVFRSLSQRQPDLLAEFQHIIQTGSLDGK